MFGMLENDMMALMKQLEKEFGNTWYNKYVETKAAIEKKSDVKIYMRAASSRATWSSWT